MAIIYSYPFAAPSISDMVLGTQFVEGEGILTKSFSIGEIGQLTYDEYATVKSLTTTGEIGPATLSAGVLNIPDYSAPYYSYYARLTQSGGTAPSVTQLHNGSPYTFTASRISAGVYDITVTGPPELPAPTFNGTWYAITDNSLNVGNITYIVINQTTSNKLRISTYLSNVISDDVLSQTPLEIKFFY